MSEPPILKPLIPIPLLDINPDMLQLVDDFSDRFKQKYGMSISYAFFKDDSTRSSLLKIKFPTPDPDVDMKQFVFDFCELFWTKYGMSAVYHST